MASNHYKSEGKLLENNLETQTEVSLVTGVEYGHQEATDTSSTVLKGVLWQQRDKLFSRIIRDSGRKFIIIQHKRSFGRNSRYSI